LSNIYVVIVTFNGQQWIRRALSSLRNSTEQSQVIVVDNASTDSTVHVVQEEYPEVEVLSLPENKGFGVGNNIGVSRALSKNAEYIFLLNQDAYVAPDAIRKLANFLSDNVEFGLATPLHCSPDLKRVDIKTQRNYLNRFAVEYLSDACIGIKKDYYKIKGINAAAWMVRASAFMKVGGFDPLFFMYGEDDDLINRFSFHNCSFALIPDARIVHLRESPPSTSSSYWESVEKMSERERSSILVDLKAPLVSFSYMLSLLLSKGIVRPLADYVVNHDGKLLIAYLLATVRLLQELPTIKKHGKQCESKGPHFLGVEQ
jgi:GT2 family glycosyltransferase